MSSLPRLLAIMGSGETSPTMVKVHRDLLARLGPPPVPAVMLDTPAAFQANVAQLGAKVVDYFDHHLQQSMTVLAMGGDAVRPGPTGAQALARLAEARYVFAGPGSPSYALAEWSATAVPELLRDKLERGGCVTFASAAALTTGILTLPVYEIYKVGQAPQWLPGLDLLSAAGLPAAVIPHFDNTDGGDHDTRFCYIGEGRLAMLEAQLPPGAWVLGIDEHTAAVFDFGAGTVTVAGRGGLTVRCGDQAERFPDGSTLPISALNETAERLGAGRPGSAAVNRPDTPDAPQGERLDERLPQTAARLDATFSQRLSERDVRGAVDVAIELESALGVEAPDRDLALARARLQTMLVRLGEAAAAGNVDRRAVLSPLVEALLAARATAREERQWAIADAVRDALLAAHIEVRDAPDATEWVLVEA